MKFTSMDKTSISSEPKILPKRGDSNHTVVYAMPQVRKSEDRGLEAMAEEATPLGLVERSEVSDWVILNSLVASTTRQHIHGRLTESKRNTTSVRSMHSRTCEKSGKHVLVSGGIVSMQ